MVRVVKNEKIEKWDENTYAKVNGVSFHNGVIEVKMLSRLLPDAPDYARGFIGIVYRANEADCEFESFYIRPANGRDCKEPMRKAHGCQYFSYPGYTFEYFREFGIGDYEAPVDIANGLERCWRGDSRFFGKAFFCQRSKGVYRPCRMVCTE